MAWPVNAEVRHLLPHVAAFAVAVLRAVGPLLPWAEGVAPAVCPTAPCAQLLLKGLVAGSPMRKPHQRNDGLGAPDPYPWALQAPAPGHGCSPRDRASDLHWCTFTAQTPCAPPFSPSCPRPHPCPALLG